VERFSAKGAEPAAGCGLMGVTGAFFGRRESVQLASVVVPLGLFFAIGTYNAHVFFGVYLALQITAGLDVLLLLIGRFFPSATLWAICVEKWLGPLPWKTHD